MAPLAEHSVPAGCEALPHRVQTLGWPLPSGCVPLLSLLRYVAECAPFVELGLLDR